MNEIEVQGNLVVEPEKITMKNGKHAIRIVLADNHSYVNKAGERVQQAQYFKIYAFGRLGKAAAFLTKGQQVVIRGRTDISSWQDRDGDFHKIISIWASTIQIPITALFKELLKNSEENNTLGQDASASAPNE